MLLLVESTSVDTKKGRLGGNFIELSGLAFDVIQDLILHRDQRVKAS